jgi:hypothetical protein
LCRSFTRSLLDLFGTFNWTTFSFVYQADGAGGANSFARDLTVKINKKII